MRSTPSEDKLAALARAWIAEDPDPATRAELQDLVSAGNWSELSERFQSRLAFGTAGIRGTLGAGPARMNRALVRRVTAGLARYLVETAPDARTRGVVVARDARHMSPEFALDTAAVLAGAGIPVHFFESPVPTPVCAFAVTALGAVAGVMITASHNPPADNGYKVYWANGAQIIPPHDKGISAAIDAVDSLSGVVLVPPETARAGKLHRPVTPELAERYYRAVLGLRRRGSGRRDLRIVYTPLHGVGGAWVEEVFRRAGYTGLRTVPEQADPHPDFPTVAFPNPEEPGAMDLALALATAEDADLVLANDPDADRLAVGVRGDRGYRMLTGNEVGLLLAHELLTVDPPPGEKVVMTTIVSSSLLRRMAQALGVHYAETLTGFKWIANRAIDYERRGIAFVFGFEEALGYTAGDVVRDKDGVSTALLLADMAAGLAAEGKTLGDALEVIYRRFGLVVAAQRSTTLPGSEGVARIAALMNALRAQPPDRIAGRTVCAFLDLRSGVRRETATGHESAIDLPPSDVLVFELEGGSRVLARPSGTEPKIKFYFEHAEQVGEGEPMAAARERGGRGLASLISSWKEIVRGRG
jgi:phosphomannomutase